MSLTSTKTTCIAFHFRDIKHKIDGGALAFSSSPWFNNGIYIIYNFNANGVKIGILHYLTRLTHIRDELGVVGSKTEDEELVRIALNGFSKPWDVFVKGMVAREKLPDWQRLWDDFVQEETRMGQGSNSSNSASHIMDEVALALAGKSKGKAKKKQGGKKNIDMSRVKCFICHKQGHFAS